MLDGTRMETSAQGQWQQLIQSAEIVLCLPSFGLFQDSSVKLNNLCALDVAKTSLPASELCRSRGSAPRGQYPALLSHP